MKKLLTCFAVTFGILTQTALIASAQGLPNSNQTSFGQTRQRIAAEIDGDESEREDKFTGGRIERAPLETGNKSVRVTVDVPSFTMTLWQGDKEVAKYYVGVGKKDYPISIGEKTASQIILNPDWYPPDSDWVKNKKGVRANERITARDPRNPLGKIKIPLGYGYLLHEAQGAGDLGSLVSHGCVRVMRNDIFDISKKIARAYGLPTANIDKARYNKVQRYIKLDEPILVDINYDTIVVENGVLHIYPDVYERGTNTVNRLRTELSNNGVNTDNLNDAALKKMLAQAAKKRQFVVSLEDVRAGRALTKGRVVPVIGRTATGRK